MKPRSIHPPSRLRQVTLLAAAALASAATQAQGGVLYKDVTTTDINNPANWSTTRGADTPDPTSIGSSDSLRFDQYFAPTSGTMYTASLSDNLTVGSVRSDYWTTGTAFGNITIGGPYTLTLSGAGDPDYGTSGIVLNAASGGTLTISSDLALGASQPWTLSRTLTVSGNMNLGSYTLTANQYGSSTSTIAGIISGSGGLTKGQSGNLNLSGDNEFTGPTTVSAGILAIGVNGLANSSSVTLNGGSLALGINGATSINNLSGASGTQIRTDYTISGTNAARTLSVNQTTDGTYAGAFNEGGSRPISLIKEGTATLAFNNQKTYTGGTTINAGLLDLTGGGGAGGTIRGTATVNTGGTLRLSTGDATGYNGGTDALKVINLVGGILNNNRDARISGGNQTLGNATVNMTGGQITGIEGSNLDFFDSEGDGVGGSLLNTLASATTSTISGTAIDIRQSQGVTFTVADGAAAVDLDISSMITNQAPTASGPGTGTSYGNNPLIKEGDGTMRISGTANNYTGATGVAAGTLVVDGSIEDSGLTTVGSGATLAGSGTVGTTEVYGTLAPSGTLVPGNGIGTLTILGSLTLGVGDEGAADFEINRDADQTADLVMIKGGLLTYAGTLNVANNSTSALQLNDTFRLFNWDEGSIAEFDFDLVNLPGLAGGLTWRNDLKTLGSITVVPEPASVLGLSLVLSSALLFRRRNG